MVIEAMAHAFSFYTQPVFLLYLALGSAIGVVFGVIPGLSGLLAMALINQPELLFLDEPSTGLDPQARRNLWDLIQRIKLEGKTIILTTHYMEEAQYLCDEIAIMDYGKIIARGSPRELIKQYSPEMTVVLPADNFDRDLEKLPLPYRKVNGTVEIKTNDVNSCLDQLISRSVDLSDLTVRSPSLESVFLNLTGRQLRD